jgi:hypothetical protein
LIATCDALEGRKSTFFLKVEDIVRELEGSSLIRDSILYSRDQMEVELGKVGLDGEYNLMTSF